MTVEEIIRELKSVEEQYRNKPVPTFEVNISSMARSCRQHIEQLSKENEELKAVCDYNCPDHKLTTHNACLICPAIRNSPYHDLKNVSDEDLQKIIKEAEEEMEM